MLQFDCHSERKLSEKDGWKLDNPFTAQKVFWTIVNNFLGKRKTPDILPSIVNDFAVSELTAKADLFNNFLPHNVLLW